MSLRFADKWLWDFWFAQNGSDYHVFYLQAPRALGNPDLRHHNASVGHATSRDLKTWQVLPDALHPGHAGTWDDLAIWTGSILRYNDTLYFFYSAICRAEHGKIQRIGLATSRDLMNWEKHPSNPIIPLDERWYEKYDPQVWHDQAWRDPWVWRDETTNDFHAFITARVNYGPADGRGVIAHAQSKDLIRWQVLPPITAPGDFGHLEVSQLTRIGERCYLLFCTHTSVYAAARLARPGIQRVTGTHYFVADYPLGSYRFSTDEFLSGDARGTMYAGKLLNTTDGRWLFFSWRVFDDDGAFAGELSDPIPVTIKANGNLELTK